MNKVKGIDFIGVPLSVWHALRSRQKLTSEMNIIHSSDVISGDIYISLNVSAI